ncbi:MAG: DUF4783 domain-containing protein [Bacteroidales bacterium]
MRKIILSLILSSLSMISFSQEISKGTYEKILGAQNINQFCQYLNSTVELTTPQKTGSYSIKQTKLILKDFFQKHTVKDFSIKHSGDFEDNSKFYLGTLKSESGKKFRIYFVSRQESNKWLIHIFKIEHY